MDKQKSYSTLGYLKYFKNIIGWHIYGYAVINFLIGFLDGLGLTMFIPLLSIATNSNAGQESLGNLEFLTKFIKTIGLNITLSSVLGFMILIFILKGSFFYFRIIYFARIRMKMIREIRLSLLQGLSNISYLKFTHTNTGRIQNNMVNNIGKVLTAMTSFFNTFQHLIMLTTYIALAFASNWQFAIMVGIGGACTNFLYRYIGKIIKEFSKKQVFLGNDFNGILIQYIQNYKYLKATNSFKKYEKKLKDILWKNDDYDYKITSIGGITESLREPIIVSIIAIVILLQVEFMKGNFNDILISLLLFYRGLGHLVAVQSNWNNFSASSVGVEEVDELITEFGKNKEPSYQNTIHHIKDINIQDISLSYGNTPILKDINFNIKDKTSIAFVGESGAGKTSLANIICGLLQPNDGKILVENQSLYESNLSSFKDKVGYITQEAIIFDDTLFNNITFWAEKTPENMEKFHRAIKMVSLENFLENLEEKEDSRLGNNGILVSGGQKQRISIARELYKDVELLIMDEATSALDSETEKTITDNIDVLHGKFTIIIIAHRLSTIKNVDEIFLLDKGEIIGSGNYNELIKKSDKFRQMVNLQEL